MSQAHASALAADLAAIAAARAATTGHGLTQPPVAAWTQSTGSDGDFARLASSIYTWWKESWADDVVLLGRLTGNPPALYEFTRSLTLIRTAQQHDDAPDATAFLELWSRRACGTASPTTPDEWRACGDALWSELRAAGTALRAAARRAAADRRLAQRWSQAVSARTDVDVGDTRDVVMGDLRLSFREGDLAYVQRQLEASWSRRVRTVRDDAQSALTHLVERYLVGRGLTDLPCSYVEVLEHLGLTGEAQALPALLLAHAVAEAAEYRDVPDFLGKVENLWRQMRDPTT